MNISKKWCIQGCKKLEDLLCPGTNVIGYDSDFYYYNKFSKNLLISRNWSYLRDKPDKEDWQIITVEEFERYILKEPSKIIEVW